MQTFNESDRFWTASLMFHPSMLGSTNIVKAISFTLSLGKRKRAVPGVVSVTTKSSG